MNLLTSLAGNYLGGVAADASSILMQRAKQVMSHVGFERVLSGMEPPQLTLDHLQLSADERAEILDLVSIAKQGELDSFELEINGQLYSIDTKSLELKPLIQAA